MMSSSCPESRLPENTVQYFLYPNVDPSLSLEDVKLKLNDLIIQYSGHLARFLTDYIWHKEPFTLRPGITETDGFIYGRTNFEDNIEDEYFIIFLLRELTLFDSGLVVRISDEDGEILLIEAAQHLDKWAQNPSRTENRVYLFMGEMHLISPLIKPNLTESDSINFPKEAVRFILNNSDKTRCSDAIQQCIIDRIKAYPSNITRLRHKAHCFLPVSIVSLLEHNPKLISHAVRAFYYRSSDDQKNVNSMKYFPDEQCLSNVQFTRCLFAQLTSQECNPDKRNIWPIPPKDAANYSAYMNGFKLAAGFEILICHYLSEKGKESTDTEIKNDIENHALWRKFISCLQSNGYFGNEIVGSKLYCHQLQQSKHYFRNMVMNFDDLDAEFDIEKQIYDYIQNINIEEELNKRKTIPLEPEDDVSWLHLDQTELDALLAEKFGCNSTSNLDFEDISKNIPDTIKQFVFNENVGLNGAEAPKKERKTKDIKDKIEFDEQEFVNFVKEIQFLVEKKPNVNDFMDGDSTDSSSMDDYGSENEDIDDDFADIENGKEKNCSTEVKAYLKQMDSELAKTVVGKTFNNKCSLARLDSDDDEDEETEKENHTESDIDLNVLSNILESYSGEAEMSTSVGPATALFATMRTKLPDIKKSNVQDNI